LGRKPRAAKAIQQSSSPKFSRPTKTTQQSCPTKFSRAAIILSTSTTSKTAELP
ncbi:hypothetical protein PIB30_109328, partial [Stylosanthes scabra]|nr:hypothetical protein [Stylosanthes scabra]